MWSGSALTGTSTTVRRGSAPDPGPGSEISREDVPAGEWWVVTSEEITTRRRRATWLRASDRAGTAVGHLVGHGSCSPRSRASVVCVMVSVMPGQGLVGKITAAS